LGRRPIPSHARRLLRECREIGQVDARTDAVAYSRPEVTIDVVAVPTGPDVRAFEVAD
jgi:hypothetical protein